DGDKLHEGAAPSPTWCRAPETDKTTEVAVKAWQFTNTHEPLVLNDIPEPTPGPGEVVLDIKAAGLCHSDVGVLDDPGWLATIPVRPVVMGHEIAGVVTA